MADYNAVLHMPGIVAVTLRLPACDNQQAAMLDAMDAINSVAVHDDMSVVSFEPLKAEIMSVQRQGIEEVPNMGEPLVIPIVEETFPTFASVPEPIFPITGASLEAVSPVLVVLEGFEATPVISSNTPQGILLGVLSGFSEAEEGAGDAFRKNPSLNCVLVTYTTVQNNGLKRQVAFIFRRVGDYANTTG